MGGLGADRFIFNELVESLVDASDRIVDFNRGQGDLIRLSNLDANLLVNGNQRFVFIGSDDFNAVGQLRYQFDDATKTGLLLAEVTGDKQADFAVEIINVNSMRAEDFFL